MGHVTVPASFAEDFKRVAELAGWSEEVVEDERQIARTIIARDAESARGLFDTYAHLRRQLEAEKDQGRREFVAEYTATEIKDAGKQRAAAVE